MKNKTIPFIAVITLAVAICLSLTACTTEIGNPSVTDKDAKLESVQLQAENKTWHAATDEQAERIFSMMKSIGELSFEAREIGISGSFTVESEYDKSFKLSYTTGNFLWKKKSDFTYNIGERITYTHSDGKTTGSYRDDKLVVRKSLSKYAATLTETQMDVFEEIFETLNASVMDEAFEKVALQARDSGYVVESIPKEELARTAAEAGPGTPFDAEDNLLKGYRITDSSGDNYIFFTASAEWAEEFAEWKSVDCIGRVCYIANSGYAGTIRNILMS